MFYIIYFSYDPPKEIKDYVNSYPIEWFNTPEKALKDVDIIVTDTWVSMGMENNKEKRLKDFHGWQVHERI